MATKQVLLVEGSNDKHVILAIQGRYPNRILDKDEIFDCGDDGRLLESLPVRLKESDLTRLGVVMDADTNVATRWQRIREILSEGGYPDVPTIPTLSGTIIEPPEASLLPRVGFWLMPDNQATGILENFLRFLVPVDCPIFAYATTATNGLPEKRFSDLAEPKALIHAWLAWQREPGRPLGQSITARYLDTDVEQVQVFMQWLKALFSDTTQEA